MSFAKKYYNLKGKIRAFRLMVKYFSHHLFLSRTYLFFSLCFCIGNKCLILSTEDDLLEGSIFIGILGIALSYKMPKRKIIRNKLITEIKDNF